MTENVKMNFFKKLVLSIKDLDQYDKLAIQPIRKGVSYFLKLILLFTVILSMMYSIQIFDLINQAKEKINDIPNFEYKDGKLSFEDNKPILYEDLSNLINSVLILPDEDENVTKEYTKKVKTYNSYLIFNKSNFVISINDNKMQFDYKELLQRYSIKSFDKAELKDFIDEINATNLSLSFFLILIMYLFIWYVITLGFDIIITFLVSSITASIARIRLKLSALINIAIHSLTLSILLYLLYFIINMLTGFEISNFRVMYILVASIYAAIAVLIIKADFIENQRELIKVIKEQQEIRKEQEENNNLDGEKDDNSNEDKDENKETDEPNGENNPEIGAQENISEVQDE